MSGFKVVKSVENPTGAIASKGDTIEVHYIGTLLSNGEQFDSSVERGRPFTFALGQGEVIKGWDEGFATMRVGEKAVITCPPDYGYGARGYPPVIPKNATLVFEVQMLGIKGKK